MNSQTKNMDISYQSKLSAYIEKMKLYNQYEKIHFSNENIETKLKQYFVLMELAYKTLPKSKIKELQEKKLNSLINTRKKLLSAKNQ